MDRHSLDIVYLRKWQDIRFVEISSAMVLLYDYCLTCSVEMNYIRTAPWTVLKALYIISRYSVFIDMSLNMWREFNHTATDSECLLYYKATIWISAVGLIACEVLLSLRLCAVYEMRRMVICSIAGLFITIYSCELILLDRWLRTVEGEMVRNRGAHLTGCILYTNDSLFHTIWVLLLVYDSVLFFMIALKGHSFIFMRSISGMRLTAVVYRKGMLYYLYIFAMSVFNVILLEKVTYMGPISSVQRVLHSVLTSRLILSIRQTANSDDSFWGTTKDVISKVRFRGSENSLEDGVVLTAFKTASQGGFGMEELSDENNVDAGDGRCSRSSQGSS